MDAENIINTIYGLRKSYIALYMENQVLKSKYELLKRGMPHNAIEEMYKDVKSSVQSTETKE